MGSWWAYPCLWVVWFQNLPKAWIGSQLFNKAYNILMILGSLAFENDFWILTPKVRVYYDFMAQCLPPKKKKRIGPKLRVYHGFVDHLLSFFWIFLLNFYFYFLFWSWKLFFLFFLKIPFLKKIIYKRIFFNYFLCKTFLFLNSFSLQKIFFFFKFHF